MDNGFNYIIENSLCSNLTYPYVAQNNICSNTTCDKVAKIKAAISSGNYPLDINKISDALMQAYREMKS